MDKKLFKEYVKKLVAEEVQRIVPPMIEEVIIQMRPLIESVVPRKNNEPPTPPPINRERIAELLNINYDGDTITATGPVSPVARRPSTVHPEVESAINKNYSELLKAMKVI